MVDRIDQAPDPRNDKRMYRETALTQDPDQEAEIIGRIDYRVLAADLRRDQEIRTKIPDQIIEIIVLQVVLEIATDQIHLGEITGVQWIIIKTNQTILSILQVVKM